MMKVLSKRSFFEPHTLMTAFLALANGINAHGEMAALYCSVENVQGISDPHVGCEQIADGVAEGWLVVFDSYLSKPWEEKIGASDLSWKGKRIHIVCC